MSDEQEDGVEYSVVVNNVRNNIRSGPSAETKGWRKAGKEGKKKDCLVYIEEIWTDMPPLSARPKRVDGENNKIG